MPSITENAELNQNNKHRKFSPIFKWWIGILMVLFAIGGYFIIERLVVGLTTTNLSSFTPWGAWIAFYIFFVGLSAGSLDRKSTRLNSSHVSISYAVFCL